MENIYYHVGLKLHFKNVFVAYKKLYNLFLLRCLPDTLLVLKHQVIDKKSSPCKTGNENCLRSQKGWANKQ